MKVDKFNQARFYLRRDPDAGWALAVWKWRVFFQVVVVKPPPICNDTGEPKWPGNCWNVRCQLGKTCCRTCGVEVPRHQTICTDTPMPGKEQK